MVLKAGLSGARLRGWAMANVEAGVRAAGFLAELRVTGVALASQSARLSG